MKALKEKTIIILLIIMSVIIPQKIFCQNDFTNKEVDAIFDLHNENILLFESSESLKLEIEAFKNTIKELELKYDISVQINKNNALKEELWKLKLKYKEAEKENEIKLWRVKRNNAYLKGGVIGTLAALLAIIAVK